MSSYNLAVRGALVAIGLICATLLPGCGFKPLYGVDSASHAPGAAAQFATVEIPVYGDRIGQQIRNILIDEMHPSGAAADYKYRLDVVTREADVSLGLQQNSTSTRGEIKLTSEYRLVDRASGKVLIHETLRSSSGYNILVNQFGTELSSEGARADALPVIADQITQHLALYFKQQTS
jgi:hypothetical protein